MPQGAAQRRDLIAQVDEAFLGMPGRYLGAEAGFDATFHVRLGDVGRAWEVRCTHHGARVRKGVTSREPDVTITTDGATWLQLRRGELSGVEAFADRRLLARGDIDLALAFEGMWRLPDGRDPLLRIRDVALPGRVVNVLTMGQGPDVLLIHGLGAAKTSFLELCASLARDGHRVHAIDLPGFGASSKPALAPYDARWFADSVLGVMDVLGIDRADVVGNSMGGRVALEMGLRAPERVNALVLLCPAVAFVKRGWHPVVRVLRPEFAMLPHRIRRSLVEKQLWGMFADPDALDPAVADVAVDQFVATYTGRGARLAFLAAARNIYLDRPFGRGGFYPRLAGLEPPALFVWGTHDPLIPVGFRRHVAEWLPKADQVVLEGCGHVPQIERADEVARLVRRYLAQADRRRGLRGARRRAPLRPAA